jgi:acyl-CoA-binding protein
MQGYFGNNTTQQPSDLTGKLLWQAWSDKKGLDKHEAKVLFLQTVDGLW